MIHIGSRVKTLMIQKGISTTDLANRLAISPQSLHGYLKRQNWRTDSLSKLAEVLEIDITDVFLSDQAGEANALCHEKLEEIRQENAILERERDLLIELMEDKKKMIELLKKKG